MYTSIGFVILGIFLGNVFKRSKNIHLVDNTEEFENENSRLKDENSELRKICHAMKITLYRSRGKLAEQDSVIEKLVVRSSASGKTPSC